MRETAGRIFKIAEDNRPVPGCTISKLVSDEHDFGITYFSMGAGTRISAESYAYPKLIYMEVGNVETIGAGAESLHSPVLAAGELLVTPVNIPIGLRTGKEAVYTEITLKEDAKMNEILKSGSVFKLKELLPYQEGKIVNMDLIDEDHLTLALMSFDQGTGLSEHAAPGEALIWALDGEGVIGYEGKEYTLHAGDNFKFDKNGRHYVKAVNSRFKMALLLTM